MGFPGNSVGQESACSAGDPGSIPGSGRSPGEENGNPLQDSHLENPLDRGTWWATIHGVTIVQCDLATKPPPGYKYLNLITFQKRQWQPTLVLFCLANPVDGGAWWAAVHGVAKSQTWLNDFTFTFHFHALEKDMATHSSVLAWRIPGDGGAWWAAICGVAQSRTRLKRLSSSNSRGLLATSGY